MLIRNEMLETAKDEHTHWDVIIIGGGASGLWTALDATTRGFKTLLVEKGDFASSASSKSTKLIHGGVRYLKQGHIPLVREALLERGYLCRNAPHLIYHRPFILGCYHWWEKSLYGLGMHIYDFLAGNLGIEKSDSYSAKKCLEICPTLNPNGLKGGVIYYDGQFDDARLSIEIAKTAELYGATLLNYCKVESLAKASGKVCGITFRDLLSNEICEAQGKVIINATGVFTDELRRLDAPLQSPLMLLSRGSHIVIDQKFFPSDHAFVIPKTRDDRIIFLIPWLGKVLIGTTDIPTDNPVDDPSPTEEEISFLLEEVRPYLTQAPKRSDILSMFAGLRPLVRSTKTSNTSKIARDHKILVSSSGLITLTGGKWTIARKMAEDCIDIAIETGRLARAKCRTKRLRLHETFENDEDEPPLHPNLPYRESDLQRAVEEEMVVTLADLLARRTRALLLDASASIEIAPKALAIMAKHFHKDEAWKKKELKSFEKIAQNYLLPIRT